MSATGRLRTVTRICSPRPTARRSSTPGRSSPIGPHARVLFFRVPEGQERPEREHLETARDDLSGAREKDAINALFYAAEAAIVALAEAHDIDTQKRHYLKAGAATELHKRGVLDRDLGALLRDLNQARKDVWYEGDDPQLDQDLDEIADEIESLIDDTEPGL